MPKYLTTQPCWVFGRYRDQGVEFEEADYVKMFSRPLPSYLEIIEEDAPAPASTGRKARKTAEED